VAFAVVVAFFVVLKLDLLRRRNRFMFITLIGLAVLVFAGTLYVFFSDITRMFTEILFEWRRGSWLVRQRVYQETIRLLPEHIIAGWGVSARIPGMASTFSAGTHSSYLGMMFQHGIIGLVLYLGLWISIWRRIIKGLRSRAISRSHYLFWISAATAMLSFNIREAADTWWWDQSLTFTVWIIWGLIITRAKVTQGAIPDASGNRRHTVRQFYKRTRR
jgi:O-antigen ligase